jgi:hypothetical protein
VIDIVEMQKRNLDQRKNAPWDHEFYIMELEKGLFVDGKRKGNLSRFINHSCDPNCELTRWEVRGRTRIGIFAKNDIKKGSSLSYDYQFETNDRSYFHCCCGSAKCRGTMAPEQRKDVQIDSTKLTKAEKAKLIAFGKEKERLSAEMLLQEELERSLTSKWLPGDERINEVRSGPSRKDYHKARAGMLYLPRSNIRGRDFYNRRKSLQKKALARLAAPVGENAHV